MLSTAHLVWISNWTLPPESHPWHLSSPSEGNDYPKVEEVLDLPLTSDNLLCPNAPHTPELCLTARCRCMVHRLPSATCPVWAACLPPSYATSCIPGRLLFAAKIADWPTGAISSSWWRRHRHLCKVTTVGPVRQPCAGPDCPGSATNAETWDSQPWDRTGSSFWILQPKCSLYMQPVRCDQERWIGTCGFHIYIYIYISIGHRIRRIRWSLNGWRQNGQWMLAARLNQLFPF